MCAFSFLSIYYKRNRKTRCVILSSYNGVRDVERTLEKLVKHFTDFLISLPVVVLVLVILKFYSPGLLLYIMQLLVEVEKLSWRCWSL